MAEDEMDFVFRAYIQPSNNDWPNRYESLLKLAEQCGHHRHWSQHCGSIEPQEWFIWSFSDHWLKEKFEIGAEKIMSIRVEGDALPMGIKDITEISNRMRRKANIKR